MHNINSLLMNIFNFGRRVFSEGEAFSHNTVVRRNEVKLPVVEFMLSTSRRPVLSIVYG